MSLVLRPGTAADAEICGAICYQAFKAIADQHNFPADFPAPEAAIGLFSHVLSRDDVYTVVAEVDGRVVASNVLWESGTIAGVGPITVDPVAQNGEVGKRLMNDVMERAQSGRFAGIRLVQAAYHNRSLALYAKLGFDVQEPLSAIQGTAVGLEIPGHAVRAARVDDLEACNALCVAVHGHARSTELRDAIRAATATVVEHDGHITGYATVVGFFGHAVAETNRDLEALIAAATSFAGPGFLLPTRNNDVLRWCLRHGLKVVQPMTLMSAGLYNQPAGAFLPSIIF